MPKRQDETGPQPQISEVSGLHEALRDKVSPRRRLAQAGALAVVLVVVVAVLIHQTVPTVNLFGVRGQAEPTATSTQEPTVIGTGLDPSDTPNVVALETNINYGFTLNGKPMSVDANGFVHLQPGNNVFILDAPPFFPMKCVITLPLAEGNDNCASAGTAGSNGEQGPILRMVVTLNDLLPAQQQALVSLYHHFIAQAAATLKTRVPVGHYFAYGYDTDGLPLSRPASIPLNAQMTVDTSATVASGCGDLLCPGNIIPQDIGTEGAAVNFAINDIVGWHFTTATGATYATLSGTILPSYATNGNQPINLDTTFDATQGWSIPSPLQANGANEANIVRNQIASNACQLGMNIIQNEIAAKGNNTNGFGFDSATTEGCKVSLMVGNNTQGTFIVRFGALLAADADAHKLLPSLPIAPDAEIVAVPSN